jgi:MoxR-like ATPase
MSRVKQYGNNATAEITSRSIEIYTPKIQDLLTQANTIILGKTHEMKLTLCCMLAGGHLLIEDMPGMGKTTLVKVLAKLLGLAFSRIQFTSDLLPADILGVSVYEEKQRQFVFHPGPIFAQLVLGDELNRASPKTQSACLQAMEEYEVTIDGETHALPKPFFFIATQNPRQSIGTFPLPGSQLDRFLMRIALGYPEKQAEKTLLLGKSRARLIENLEPALHAADLLEIQAQIEDIYVSDALADYLMVLIQESRTQVSGLSPRAGIDLLQAARSWAFLEGRTYVLPEDIQAVAVPVMNHRLGQEEDGINGIILAEELIRRVPVD